jgi:hypothetical protein
VRRRCAKDGHDTIADVLINVAAMCADESIDLLEEALEQSVELFRI